ncbi:MAG: TSCPD domain-containing protein, partial [Actinomycetota bacterium]
KIAEQGNLDGMEEVPQKYRRTFITAHQISPVWHVRMQAAFQKFVDNAVSKTVNFPNNAREKDVEDVYMLAYRLGCKGITIYRDGSRESQVLQVEKKEKKAQNKEQEQKVQLLDTIKPRSRPEVTRGMTKKFVIGGCGKLYVTVNSDEQGICEVFTNTGEEGCSALTEAIGRLISISIRSGIAIGSIQSQLEGIRCITCIADNKTHVLSCPDAIGKAMEFYLKGTNKFDLDVKGGPRSIMICPEDGCGGIMEPEGGCYVCRNCGYSKCS